MRVLLFPLLGLAAATLAQSVDAVLTGTVTDPSGAAVPGASVAARNVRTGVRSQSTSSESGVYVFPSLAPGVYRVTVERTGFRTVVYDDVTLEVGARLSLNLSLPVGGVTETVEVKATSENLLGYETSSVGGIVTGQKVLDLPLPARNSLGLVYTQAGLVGDNFAGSRIGALNITLDGINVQDQRLNQGVSSPIYTSVDKIEEFRVITSPADAELGRGSGQIQMLTRSGTNEFHGSLFEFHRNTVLTANTWFNNQRGLDPATGQPISPRNFLARNQYGGRIGGPVLKNRTFFHFLYDAQKIRERRAVTYTVYTEQARRGLFRFFPGVRNGNVTSSNPVVDLLGNPVVPSGATGDLQTVSVFGRDPARPVPDPSGTIRRLLDLTPLPNNFRSGDGLNTAGFTWSRPSAQNLAQYNVKIDHHFNSFHRASFSYTHENQANRNLFSEQPFPRAPGGQTLYRDRLASLNVWSTLTPTLLNEFRAGSLRPWLRWYTGWEVGDNISLLPAANGNPYLPVFDLVSNPLNQDDNPVGRISPLYQFTNNVTWLRGRHAFKAGFEIRFSSTNAFNSTDVMPRAVLGTGGVPVLNINTIPGIGQNQGTAIAMLNELAGSVASVRQAFNSPGGANPVYLANEVKQRTWKRREIGMFFKDDFKVTPHLTLNLGVRWEFYGVPYDANGRTSSLEGGVAGLFGISGTGFGDMYQPGRMAGSMTRVNLVGPNSPNPGLKLHNNDWNNFAPAVGISWALPWFRRKTILRAGYSIAYERNSLRIVDVVSGDQPGLRDRTTFQTASYLDLSSVRLPLTPPGQPLSLVPLTDRTQIVRVFDDNLRNPYIQNFNVSVQREIARNTVFDIRYVGSKGTRLVRGTSINETIIFENGVLEAFRVTQSGGHAPLLDRIFGGISVPGLGVVDGVRITGSDAVRAISTTQSHLALHNVATFADYLSSTPQFTNQRGGLLRRAGLPENFVYVNPQFASARLTGNFANSTWHSLQIEIVKRFSAGWTFQGNYTWSRALGEEEGAGEEMIDSYRDLRNWRLDKRLMGFHRTHVFRNSGTWALPFGRGKRFLHQSRWVDRVAGGWQFGVIFNLFSGAPLTVSSGRSSWNTFGDNTPTVVAPFDKATGRVQREGNGVVYFSGLRQVQDPSVPAITEANGIRARSTLLAVTDDSGRLLLVNPTPGTLGNLAPGFLQGPGEFRFDVNLLKRIRLREAVTLELRVDAIGVTNTPQFNSPNADINSVNFGRITGATGNRIVVVGGRVNF